MTRTFLMYETDRCGGSFCFGDAKSLRSSAAPTGNLFLTQEEVLRDRCAVPRVRPGVIVSVHDDAMANGIPVMTLSTPRKGKSDAQAELVEHKVTGFVCKFRRQYAGAVVELLKNQ